LDYLSGVGEYRDRSRWPRPHLVLLDLKVPLVDGLEILEWVRRHPALQNLPVFVLTSSDETKEQRRAFELGVSGYFLKTATFEGLPAQIRGRLAALRAYEEEEPGRALKGLAA
jgi:DNA-binding response OmpR family regulator